MSGIIAVCVVIILAAIGSAGSPSREGGREQTRQQAPHDRYTTDRTAPLGR